MHKSLRTRLFLRSFLVQGAWNYERMQNVGFAYSLLPVLKAAHTDKKELARAVSRHLELFNTQPFMSSLILGMAARAEELIAAAPPERKAELEEQLRETKSAMSTAVAAIGDRLFWGLLRPLSLILSLVILGPGLLRYLFTVEKFSAPTTLPAHASGLLVLALLAGLLFYNIPAIWLRWRGLEHGYDCQGTNSCGVDLMDWHSHIRKFKFVGFALSAVLFLLLLSFFTRDFVFKGDADYGLHSLAVVVFSVAAALFAKRYGFTSLKAYLGLMALFAVAFVIF